MYTVLTISLCGSFILLYFYFAYCYGYWKRRGIDCLTPSFPFGNVGALFQGVQSMNVCVTDVYRQAKGPYTGFYIFNKPALMIKDPELIKLILIRDFSTFQDRGMYCDEKREPLSGHLFRLNGSRWKYMRSKLTPSFSIGKLKMMFDTIVHTGRHLENTLDALHENGELVDFTDYSVRYSSDIIASVIFGIEVNSFRDPDNHFQQIVQLLINKPTYWRYMLFTLVSLIPSFIKFLRLNTLHKKSTEQIFKLVTEVVEYREKNKVTRNDFMQLLIQLKNMGEVNVEDNVSNFHEKNSAINGLSIEEITAQAYTMFFAGFDTSATTITYALYELAKHPLMQERVQKEIDQCLAKYNGELTYDALSEMEYLYCCINETLRLYPILGFLQRRSNSDYKITNSNHIIEKGTYVYICMLGMHTDPDFFPDPNEFKPDRFLPENKSKIQFCSYLPFGEGPRNCIGKKMGGLQTAVGLVMVLRKHSVRMPNNPKPFIINPYSLPHVPIDNIDLILSKRIVK